jgi:hypothetical protein
MKKNNNPIVQAVIDKFDMVYKTTTLFLQNTKSKKNKEDKYSAIKGLLICGDAGTGKSHFVQKACIDMQKTEDVKKIKGSITAAALYVALYMYREEGKVLMLDDCDILNLGAKERSAIIDMFKAATELTKGDRLISWERAAPNPLMVANDVPNSFNYQGSIVWITNDTITDFQSKLKNHWMAIDSRFTTVPITLNKEEKLLYTIYLIEEVGMLGKSCQAKEAGYPIKIQNETINFINENYKMLNDITPRMAIKVADTIYNHPSDWKKYLQYQI